MTDHFSPLHKKAFNQRNIEFICNKGYGPLSEGQPESQSQDNFFCVVDKDMKIFGVFDGHGSSG